MSLCCLEFIPLTVIGFVDENLDGFAKNVVNKNYKTVLAFNEPERSDQANMSPDRAAYLWKTYLEPLHSQHGVRLGAPAVSSAPEGKTWLKNFIAKCDGCHIDFIPVCVPSLFRLLVYIYLALAD